MGAGQGAAGYGRNEVGRVIRLLALALALAAVPAGAQTGQGAPYRPPGTITATPFQFAPVTVYRDARGRSIGTATEVGGVAIYRRSR